MKPTHVTISDIIDAILAYIMATTTARCSLRPIY